jgi:NADH dehydrogenase [ubiquinone] 1 alpha subcomplex assembly factor 7
MKYTLNHPQYGYYKTRDVFGRKGDFITSPEITQLFGEMLAIYFLSNWQMSQCPPKVHFVELGPGRGTLAKDFFRVFSTFGKRFPRALQDFQSLKMPFQPFAL